MTDDIKTPILAELSSMTVLINDIIEDVSDLEGSGFSSTDDSLKAISEKLGTGGITGSLEAVIAALNSIAGSDFSSVADSLDSLQKEIIKIRNNTTSLLSKPTF